MSRVSLENEPFASGILLHNSGNCNESKHLGERYYYNFFFELERSSNQKALQDLTQHCGGIELH